MGPSPIRLVRLVDAVLNVFGAQAEVEQEESVPGRVSPEEQVRALDVFVDVALAVDELQGVDLEQNEG